MPGEPNDDIEDSDCGCADRVKPGEYYHCPICDAEWPADDDGDTALTAMFVAEGWNPCDWCDGTGHEKPQPPVNDGETE